MHFASVALSMRGCDLYNLHVKYVYVLFVCSFETWWCSSLLAFIRNRHCFKVQNKLYTAFQPSLISVDS